MNPLQFLTNSFQENQPYKRKVELILCGKFKCLLCLLCKMHCSLNKQAYQIFDLKENEQCRLYYEAGETPIDLVT